MKINKKYFPSVIKDNDEEYISRVSGFIESIDELSSLQITYNKSRYGFRLAPSHPKYAPFLFEELISFHKMLNITLDISKSIKATGTIAFSIKSDNYE